jgi:hypothetical protein
LGGTIFFTQGEIVLALPTGSGRRIRDPHDPSDTPGITTTQTISTSILRLNYTVQILTLS